MFHSLPFANGALVLLSGFLAALTLSPEKALAQPQAVLGSPHDFASSEFWPGGLDGEKDNPCVFCHTAAGEIAEETGGLSSRQIAYRMYDSPTMDASRPQGPTGTSLACLACHDGVIASQAPTGEEMVLGADLSDDHPISIEYDPSMDAGLRPVREVTRKGLKLFNEGGIQRVQCATCHDPHGDGEAGPFLRVDNTGSQLCLSCHDK